MKLPPKIYFSPINYGPTIRLAIPPELDTFRNPEFLSQGSPEYYTYHFSYYDPEHQWQHIEPYGDYLQRMRDESSNPESDFLAYNSLHNNYPKDAAIIVTILPAWVYLLQE